jgi:hypothetical protein
MHQHCLSASCRIGCSHRASVETLIFIDAPWLPRLGAVRRHWFVCLRNIGIHQPRRIAPRIRALLAVSGLPDTGVPLLSEIILLNTSATPLLTKPELLIGRLEVFFA